MPTSSTPTGQEVNPSALLETLLEFHEQILVSQLSAVRKLRSHPGSPHADAAPLPQGKLKRKGRSHLDMAFDILTAAGTPLHASEIAQITWQIADFARLGRPFRARDGWGNG